MTPATDAATDTPAEPGLRERKRRATRRAILLAAIEIVRDRGLDAATVDEISRVADVSPRTFFNYFSSKEEAIVGDGPQLPDAEVVEAFVAARGPIFTDLVEVFGASVGHASADPELIVLRRSIMKSNPELAARRFATLHRFEAQMIETVRLRLVSQHPDGDPAAQHSRARLYGLVAIAAMRTAWFGWLEAGEAGDPRASGADGLLEHLRGAFAQLADLATDAAPR